MKAQINDNDNAVFFQLKNTLLPHHFALRHLDDEGQNTNYRDGLSIPPALKVPTFKLKIVNTDT